jgi:hypothetical protein
MIKYKLICNNCKNKFDSWFSSSSEYEKLKKLKHLSCNFCESISVKKTLMTPNLTYTKKKDILKIKNEKTANIKNKIKEYQKFVKKNFDYVGENFAYEARSMHYNKKKSKGIYGDPTNEEIKELSEEGIETDILPWFENKEN